MSSSLSTTTASQSSTSTQLVDETTIDNFCNYVEQWLCACCHVWAEDQQLQKVKLKWEIGYGSMSMNVSYEDKKKMLLKWNDAMAPYYSYVAKRDSSFMAHLNPDDMHGIDINKLFHSRDITQSTRDHFWEYLDAINKTARMGGIVSSCPGTVMDKISSVATDIASKIENSNGETTLADFDILGLGKQVAESLQPDELQAFSTSMLQNAGNIGELYRSIAPSQGMGGGGGGGLGGLMSMLLGGAKK